MSRLVLPPVAAVPGTVDIQKLHLVPNGSTRCTVCNQSKFQMRFRYTDETNIWLVLCSHDSFAMYDPVERMMLPFETCRKEHVPVQ